MVTTLRKYLPAEKIHILGIVILFMGMPLSPALMTIGQILLIVNWLLDNQLLTKFRKALTNKSVLAFLGIIIIHLIGLLYTENFDYAWRDLRVKWPLLFLPIIFSTTSPLSEFQWRLMLKLFGIVVFLGTMYSIYIYFTVGIYDMQSTRNISIFISHIRFALMITLSIFIFIYMLVFTKKNDYYFRWWGPLLVIWFIVFLILLRSLTGLVILGVGTLFIGIWFTSLIRHYVFRLIVYMSILGFVLIGISFFIHSWAKYNYRVVPQKETLPKYTVNGNKYIHYLSQEVYENSHFVYSHICSKELRKEWEKRSNLIYDGKDKVGHQLKHTLIRYLASRGLTKDSVGISKLSRKDILAVENGIANYIYLNNFSLYARLYRVFWEIEKMEIGANPGGLSLVQRVYYFDAGWNIFKQTPIFGVGTGDVQDSFNQYYKETNSVLKKRWRLRAHNQFLTILLTFGVVGFTIFILAIFYPVYTAKQKQKLNAPFIIFLFIALTSMLNEDTLETQAGVLFFVVFYVLFRWGIKEHPISKQTKKNKSNNL